MLALAAALACSLLAATPPTRAAEEAPSPAPAPGPAPRPAPAPGSGRISLNWRPELPATNRWRVELRGLEPPALRALQRAQWTEPDWNKLLRVVVEQDNLAAEIGLPAVAGTYFVDDARVVFQPRYPLQPGVRYRADLQLRHLPAMARPIALSSSFRPPTPVLTPATTVTTIYPTAAELPENLLKFYLEFSAPMSAGGIYDHIHLYDQNGRAIELPFLEINEELWDPSMTRLTLFIDPGRIKRGVTPLEEIGPALQAGHRYSLVIDAAWPDARGAALKAPFEKKFKVAPPDRTPINPGAWKITAPAANSTQPLIVRFDRAMDAALARRLLNVQRAGARRPAEPWAGQVQLRDAEREWQFVPAQPWPQGDWQLVVPSILEDLAGNNIGKAFEVDLFDRVQRRVTNAVTRLPFAIR